MVVKRRRPCARRRWAAGVGAVDLSPSSPSTSTCLFFCFFFPSSSLFCFFFFFFSFCSFFPIFCLLFFSSSLFSHCHFLSLVFLLLILIFLGYHLGDYGRFAAVFEWICYIEFKGELKNTCKRIDNEFEDFKVLTSPQRTKTSSNLGIFLLLSFLCFVLCFSYFVVVLIVLFLFYLMLLLLIFLVLWFCLIFGCCC